MYLLESTLISKNKLYIFVCVGRKKKIHSIMRFSNLKLRTFGMNKNFKFYVGQLFTLNRLFNLKCGYYGNVYIIVMIDVQALVKYSCIICV